MWPVFEVINWFRVKGWRLDPEHKHHNLINQRKEMSGKGCGRAILQNFDAYYTPVGMSELLSLLCALSFGVKFCSSLQNCVECFSELWRLKPSHCLTQSPELRPDFSYHSNNWWIWWHRLRKVKIKVKEPIWWIKTVTEKIIPWLCLSYVWILPPSLLSSIERNLLLSMKLSCFDLWLLLSLLYHLVVFVTFQWADFTLLWVSVILLFSWVESYNCGKHINTWQIYIGAATEFAPDFTIISAGFDAARGDPLGCCDVRIFLFWLSIQPILLCYS